VDCAHRLTGAIRRKYSARFVARSFASVVERQGRVWHQLPDGAVLPWGRVAGGTQADIVPADTACAERANPQYDKPLKTSSPLLLRPLGARWITSAPTGPKA
jgi:hypothetical protein